MANKTISELTNAALPLAGTDKTIVSRDGVTLNDVSLSDLKSYIGTSSFVSTAFSTTLAFDGVNKEMIQQAVTGALAFISSGSTIGTQINMCLVANGTNVPTFASNFKKATGTNPYNNTANVKNYFQFIYTNNKILYSLFQEEGDTGVVETLPVNTVAPVLSAVTVGGTLSCTNGTWTGNPTPTYTQQFKLDGVNIASNYTVVSGDVGKVVTCVVTATNSQGSVNATSNSQTVAAGATAPAQVTGLTLGTPTSTTQPLTWTAPSNGGSAITDYLVEYKAASSGTWLTFSDGTSTATSATVTGLTASTSYNYRVSAINAIGTGTASATATGSTTSASATPMVLLHMETTSFVDSSPSARTVTKVGSQSTTNSKAGFGNCYSNGGSSTGYLTIDGTDFDFGAASDFTLECLVNTTATGLNQGLIIKGSGTSMSATTRDWGILVNGDGKAVLNVSNGTTTLVNLTSTTTVANFGTWYHVAAVRRGNVFELYVNGVLEATVTQAITIPTNTRKVIFASTAEATGGATTLAWVMDEAVIWNFAKYNGTFTPPTAPY